MTNSMVNISYINKFLVDEDFYLTKNIFNFPKLLEMVIQTSGDHDQYISQQLAVSFLEPQETWVITQNHFHVFDYPSIGTEIEIETRVSNANRFFVDRWFGIRADNKLLMEFQIQYTIINLSTRKMARVPAKKLIEHNLIDSSYYQIREKIIQPEDVSSYSINSQTIAPEDIDLNQHVNNLVYIRWGARAMPLSILTNFSLEKVAIKYGSEILPDHQVMVETFLPPNVIKVKDSSEQPEAVTLESLESFQVIYNETTDQEACILHFTWIRNI